MHCGTTNTTNIGVASLTIVNEGPEKTCSDDIDNDGDGVTDCEDSDCSKKKQCKLNLSNKLYL